MNLYTILVINGCISLMVAGCFVAIKTNNYSLALADICVGVANLIFMLK